MELDCRPPFHVIIWLQTFIPYRETFLKSLKVSSSTKSPDKMVVADRLVTRSNYIDEGRDSAHASSETPYRQEVTEADIETLALKLRIPAGSELDPHAPTFDAKLWVKSIIDLWCSDPSIGHKRNLGVAFSDLSVSGRNSTTPKYQQNTGGVLLDVITSITRHFIGTRPLKAVSILQNFEGVINDGELLLVLGPPGSGCTTLLKTIAGETTGLNVSLDTKMNFRGIKTKYVRTRFRGDVLYNAERDVNLPHLTVGETLTFAARARSMRTAPPGLTRSQMEVMSRDVIMSVLGISHTFNTRVGDDFVRGVSGGERKRVSIAEAALTGARLQCWDNSTRGLDSGNAVNFCESLRGQADLLGISAAVAIYQAPQSAYELFDKVTVLYDGRQIYFGPTSMAREYFEELGFYCPDRQTTADFLTSMTSPNQRQVRSGYENLAPRTPDEFVTRWKESMHRKLLLQELSEYELKHPTDERLMEFKESRRVEQSKSQWSKSPYNISYFAQVSLNLWRGWRRLVADPAYTIASLVFQMIMAITLGSLFYDMKQDTSTFYYRGGVIFFSLLFNAFASQLEVLTVYAERPVVEKQHKYAFYSLSTQAIASFVMDLPYKTANMIAFNLIVYFMTHLRRDTSSFLFFSLVTYLATLVMSCLYRTLAYLTRTPAQAMVPSALLSIGLIIYTGFCIPSAYLPGWSEWMLHINPLSYAFEALMANEFHGRSFPCASKVPQGPGYEDLAPESQTCFVVGARAGDTLVNGDDYIRLTFGYLNENKWRNVGILAAYLVGLFCLYIATAELSKPPKSQGEYLVFWRGAIPRIAAKNAGKHVNDEEDTNSSNIQMVEIQKEQAKDSDFMKNGASVFHWEDLCYDVKVKGETRRLLDHVDGWVKPGTSTALMGVSGAGKTTLLDVLATRVTVGVVSGSTLINGTPTDTSFPHRVGYVQQQDVHLATATVREALEFSALLRQPAKTPHAEKLAWVDEVIAMLGMEEFAGAVVGIAGEHGLNVEQRKRLSVGVELAARPDLLVFLDEPTSGLDAQTSWAICDLIETLTRSGQAVLCTIHQPSAMLFQRFDRLLLLAAGGKTVYFGDLGHESSTLIEYMERNGATKCPASTNPAEWMLQSIQQPTDGTKGIDWFEAWRQSPEYQAVKSELSRLKTIAHDPTSSNTSDPSLNQEFVASTWIQFKEVTLRTGRHFWRSPTYIWSKTLLVGISSLYIGFSFDAKNSLQGLQNQLYAIYMFFILFGSLNEQIMPTFIPMRDLYEVRERPSKIYKWTAFLWSNILVEAFYNCLMAVLAYLCWYYPVGFIQNTTATDTAERGAQVFLFLLQYMLFTSTFSHFAIAWIATSETAGVLVSLLWLLCISFSGIAVKPADLPSFWKFMYRVSPCNYLISGIMSASLTGSPVVCTPAEILHMQPPVNQTCADFLGSLVATSGGNVLASTESGLCSYCPISTTDVYLSEFRIFYADVWRNFGIGWSYIIANVFLTFLFFWLFRVPKGNSSKRA
ncbi:unnamed protein product [Periconia digitata]|uniref:ABC transporter domain-containing protein n=1 Tax=Periconia digitata TaxID=1303443 RepID=A0A9W4XNN5_9PLEO|nr:unnamed protein product [Periconia digitata]